MIQRLHKPTPKQLEAAARRQLPLIITGLVDDWDISDWTPEYLAKKYPKYPCRIARTVIEQMSATKYILVPLKKFVEIMNKIELDPSKTKENFYFLENRGFLQYTGLEKILENEIEDYRLPSYVNYLDNRLATNVVFLGPKGSRTGFHTDDDHRNYLCQITGSKRLWLAPPSQTPYMYRSTKYEFGGMTSEVDRWDVDLNKHPLYQQAKIISVDLEEGDMAYIPRQWWHAAENLTPVSCVGWRYETLPTYLSKQPKYRMKEQLHKAGLYRPGNCTCCSD